MFKHDLKSYRTNGGAMNRFTINTLNWGAVLCFGLLAIPGVVLGQGVGEPSAEDSSILQAIEAGLAANAADATVDETQKANIDSLFQRAKQSLLNASQLDAQASQFNGMAEQVAEKTSAVAATMQELANSDVQPDRSTSIDQLSQRLNTAQSELTTTIAEAAKLSAEPARRKKRLTEIPAELTSAEQTLSELQEQFKQPPPANETQRESEARVTLLKARMSELQSSITALNLEQNAYIATSDLLAEQKTLAEQKVSHLRQQVDELRQVLADKQKIQAEGEADALRQTVDQVPQELRELALSNFRLADEQQQYILDASAANTRLEEIQESFVEIKADLTSSEERVEAVGLTDALGVMLREHRQEYEKLRAKYRPNADLKKKIQDYQIETFQIEDEIRKLDEKLAAEEDRAIDWESEEFDWSALSSEEAQWVLNKQRRKILAEILQSKNNLLQTMLTSDTQQRELLQSIDRFNTFVDQKLFWTRSAPAVSLAELQALPQASRWFMDPANWSSVASSVIESGKARPLRALLSVLALAFGIYLRSAMRRMVAREGKLATKVNASYRSTLIALVATAAAAVVWPGSFWIFSYFLSASPVGNAFARGLGQALGVVGVFVASRELLKEACRSDGLADAHFGWSENVRLLLRRNLRWYTLLGGIAIFLMVTMSMHPETHIRTLGTRLSAVLLFLATAAFHHVVLRGKSPLYVQLVQINPDSVIYRWRNVIWWGAVSLPILFAAMALAGYLDTTIRLGRSMQSTFLLLIVLVIGLGLASRWLTLQKRNLARKRAKETRTRQAAKGEGIPHGEGVSDVGITIEEEAGTSLPVLDQQTRQSVFALAAVLGCVGFAYIWADVLPALEFFDGITAWKIGTGDKIEIVSFLDVGYCILGIVATLFAARNLPSMLELLILSRTSLDSGARYAISTLLRYVIFTVGAFFVLNLLSVPYNQLGWLLAAASVGLGFGLQEIVANFVSGIILLLERPARVGDVVTIDGTTGVVSRIQMRATTVTSWDRKELVVPNKDLITQKLLNWSLSNVINRLTISVGVEYGADPDFVRELLHKVVAEHPSVMKDPAPLVNLETFGDSSLVFHIRFFLSELDSRIETTHQVNTGIARALKEAGISIPFPQRDLNLNIGDTQQDIPIAIRRL